MTVHSQTWVLVSIAAMVAACPLSAAGGVVRVRDVQGLRQAVEQATPGTRILLASGEYAGGLYFRNVRGAPGRPIVIAGADPAHPPVLVGGANNLQISDPAYLELRDLVLRGATTNGLNLDDAGTFETPAHHVRLYRLRVMDVGPQGNRDGIKLSGLDDFRIEECVVQRWGDGGSGIDMVGCHRGVIEGCTFSQGEGRGGEGVQCKGGTSEITIRRNRFVHAGARGVNIGGSTGLAFFRPRVQGYEAKDIRVEGNIFVGCQAPVAFVGVDGAVVRFNTIYRPGRWALRILQETREPGFVPSRNGVFEDNIVVYRSDAWSEGGVNIGPDTAPGTFRFARNLWFCEDRPNRSRPTLPTAETDGIVGKDPLFVAADRGDFRLRAGSPAAGKGAMAYRGR